MPSASQPQVKIDLVRGRKNFEVEVTSQSNPDHSLHISTGKGSQGQSSSGRTPQRGEDGGDGGGSAAAAAAAAAAVATSEEPYLLQVLAEVQRTLLQPAIKDLTEWKAIAMPMTTATKRAQLLAQPQAGCPSIDLFALREVAQKLRGSAGYIGALGLAAAARAMVDFLSSSLCLKQHNPEQTKPSSPHGTWNEDDTDEEKHTCLAHFDSAKCSSFLTKLLQETQAASKCLDDIRSGTLSRRPLHAAAAAAAPSRGEASEEIGLGEESEFLPSNRDGSHKKCTCSLQ